MEKNDIDHYLEFDKREKYHGKYYCLGFYLCMNDLLIAFQMKPICYSFVFAIIIKSLNN